MQELEVFREDIPRALSGELRADQISSVHHIAYPTILKLVVGIEPAEKLGACTTVKNDRNVGDNIM